MSDIGSGRVVLRYESSEYFIERDGQRLFCPFHQGRASLCGPWCPHFQLRKSNTNGFMLTLTCGRGPTMTVEDGVAQ
jgi:hypothetical protein